MAEALKHQIPEIGAGRWLRDLAATISPVSEALSVMLIAESTDDSKIDPNRYLEIGIKVREVVGMMKARRLPQSFDGDQLSVMRLAMTKAGTHNPKKGLGQRCRRKTQDEGMRRVSPFIPLLLRIPRTLLNV